MTLAIGAVIAGLLVQGAILYFVYTRSELVRKSWSAW